MVVITGSGSDWLLGEAASAALPVIIEPSLRAPIDLRSNALALRRLAALPRQGNFGVVHTHCAKAGAVGRLAAHRNVVSRIVHTYRGSRFTNSSRPPAVARMWPSSAALPADGRDLVRGNRLCCRGDKPWARRSGAGQGGRRGSEQRVSHLSRRCRHVAAAPKAGPPCAGSACRGHRGRRGGATDLPEGSRGLCGCPGRTRPSRRDRSMDWRRELAERVASMAKSTPWVA